MTRRCESYSGVCYDGPREGEHVTSSTPTYFFPMLQKASCMRKSDEPLRYGTFLYRWSHAIRKWIFYP